MTLSRYAAVLATGPVDQVHMTYLRKMDPPPTCSSRGPAIKTNRFAIPKSHGTVLSDQPQIRLSRLRSLAHHFPLRRYNPTRQPTPRQIAGPIALSPCQKKT